MLTLNGKLPNAIVSRVGEDGYETVQIADLFDEGINILVGVPGVFTPICTEEHLPSLIEAAPVLKNLGVKEIYCISDDHNWAIEAWKSVLPGSENIVFLSDGNRDLLSKINMANDHEDLFISGKYARFYAVIHDRKIKRLRAEQSVLKTVSTKGECIITDIHDVMKQMAEVRNLESQA